MLPVRDYTVIPRLRERDEATACGHQESVGG